MKNKTKEYIDLEIAIKLSINQTLYDKGYITKDMYEGAKDLIFSQK